VVVCSRSWAVKYKPYHNRGRLREERSCRRQTLVYAEYGSPTNGPKIYRSTDEGGTWTEEHQEDSFKHVHHVAPDPHRDEVWIASLGDSGSGRFLESTDSGQTWAQASKYSYYDNAQAVAFDFGEDWIYFSDDSNAIQYTVPWAYHRESGETTALCSVPAETSHPQYFANGVKNQGYGLIHDDTEGVTYFEVRNEADLNSVRNVYPIFYV